MTLNEAIEHCKEIAKDNIECNACCNEHLQLAMWLEELKEYREKEVNQK